ASESPGESPQSAHIRAPDGGSLLVRGRYPRTPSKCVRPERPSLLARYPGTLSVKRSDDGTLSLNVTLPFERYLQGIAEVPPSWPTAALEAQAIAARSYALATTGWSGSQGQTLKTPICATTSCQVYAGIPVPPEADIRRWYRAVRATAGEVLLYQGRPAETVYFSTSNGHTYGNDQVFGSAPLAYLRPVVERDDGASPTSRWRVLLPVADLARFLHAAGDWPGGRMISSVRLDGTTIVVSGAGASRSMDLGTFRDDVNAWAPCLEPGRYPPVSLPVTIPSQWLTVSSDPDAAVVTGRGWGHGVGMVQWGAYGKALRGYSASDILAYYYGGLRPQTYPGPGLIHVRVASGLTSLRIVPSGPGATLDGRVLGSGLVSITGGDRLTVTTGAA
ncbi:MAG TPA: SpoIID/LytB domain-containing protein, partial [Actinomycetota bacterium]|nr:SpoIID/LytB domain-containing protein [Actinomycetota bacterium]